jgi:hypothetical protein
MTIVGYLWLWDVALPFFIGKALTFYIYYITGYVLGRQFVEYLEVRGNSWRIMIAFFVLFAIAFFMGRIFPHYEYVAVLSQYTQFLILPVVMLCLFKRLTSLTLFMNVFLFLGSNSLIIFGLHDMYLSILRIVMKHFLNVDNSMVGALMVLLTLLLCFPTTMFFKRWIPKLVGKTPLLKLT